MRPARMLLIDEPSLGLAPVRSTPSTRRSGELKHGVGATIVLVEENFTHIGGIADRVHILEAGKIVRSGSFEDVSSDRTVVETYLGAIVEGGG